MTTHHPYGRFVRTFSLEFPEKPTADVTVLHFEGEEQLSRPYRFVIDFASRNQNLDDLVNRNAVFIIGGPATGRKSVYRGVVAEIEQKGRVKEYDFYRVVVVPAMTVLAGYVGSEIYIDNQTVPEVIQKIFEDNHLLHVLRPMPLITTDPLPFICQYEESLLHFVTRLMEREGIYYFFEEQEDRENVVITCSRLAHIPLKEAFIYHEASRRDDKHGESTIASLAMRRRAMPHKLVLKSYNYRHSSVEAQQIDIPGTNRNFAPKFWHEVEVPRRAQNATVIVKEDGVGETVLTDDYFRTDKEGELLAGIRAEEILCRERLFTAESAAVGLKAGTLFNLTQPYRKDFNQQYLVSAVSHSGSQPAAYLRGLGIEVPDDPDRKPYWNRLQLIPGSLQFRPQRLTPKPRIGGTITAIVDSEGSGTYAVINADGEYKVRFPTLGRKRPAGKASCWMRMASPYGGKSHGQHFPLLKGTEVMVAFKDGDPDQPFISGTVPNSTNTSVVTEDNLTDNVLKTASGNSLVMGDQEKETHLTLTTAGGHLLDMNDGAGKPGIGLATQSGNQSVNLKDAGAKGEIVLAASTPLEAMGISAPHIANLQENQSRFRLGKAVSGIEMSTNDSFNRVTLVSDSSISMGNHSKLALGVMSSFALGMDSAVAGGPYSRDLLWGGSEYSAKTITRFCGQEYVNINSSSLLGGKKGVVIGGGFLPTVGAPYESLKTAFLVSLAASVASTGAGCTTGIMHSPLEAKMAVIGVSLTAALIMWKIKDGYFTAITKAPARASYAGLLELDYKGARLSSNPFGPYLDLNPLGATLASDDTDLSCFKVGKQGVALKGVLIDVDAELAARLHGKSVVIIESDGQFAIQSNASGMVKTGDSFLSLLPGAAQLVSGGIIKIG